MKTRRNTLIVCVLLLEAACGSVNGAAGGAGKSGSGGADGGKGADALASLTRVVAKPPTSSCPNGGIAVEAGVDTNSNQQLDDDEVTSAQDVCNGPSLHGQLTASTLVPANEASCTGELLIQVGTDDGAQDGVANDGILQDGEVQTSWYVCPAAPVLVSDITPPSGPSGSYTLDASAGRTNADPLDSQDIAEVSGGPIALYMPQSSGGGHVKVFSTGDAGITGSQEAVWAFPTAPSPNLGSNPVTLSGSVIIAAVATSLSASTPEYFTISDDQPQAGQLYEVANGVVTAVTSLTIALGAQITVNENDSLAHVSRLRVPGDIINAGKIVPAASTTSLDLACATYNGALTSSITHHSGGVTIQAVGAIYNMGLIDTTGVEGLTGFHGGAVKLVSQFGEVFNSGAIDSSGRENTTGSSAQYSGKGGDITLDAARGVYNSGALSANGADIHTKSFGGAGGNITLNVRGEVNNGGPSANPPVLRNTGALWAKGGPCSQTKCQGGVGGAITLQNPAGAPTTLAGFVAIANAASLTATGGSVNGDQAESRGGSGGSVKIFSSGQGSGGQLGNVKTVAGSIYLSGSISTAGGDGDANSFGNAATPTKGGEIDISVVSEIQAGQEIVLLGYASISSNGGACANVSGGQCGNGGVVSLHSASRGGIVNYAKINALGGSGFANTTTGKGGTVVMSAGQGSLPNAVSDQEFVINHGDFSLRGGNATQSVGGGSMSGSQAGYGGTFSLIGAAKVENFGALKIDQGLSATPLLAPTDPMYFSLLSSGGGPVINLGNISGNGGQAAVGLAGTGQRVMLIGQTVQNSGAISVNGGSYENTLSSVNGGGGGAIHLTSTNGQTSNADVSLLSAKAGAKGGLPGGKHGADGIVSIDGVTIAQ